jgi:hypothetical protein
MTNPNPFSKREIRQAAKQGGCGWIGALVFILALLALAKIILGELGIIAP